MKQFAKLFATLDQTNSTKAKVEAMTGYFTAAPPAEAAWAVFFLTGRRLKRLVPHVAVSQWTRAATGLEEWMLMECYAVVGDGAETAALVLDQLPPVPDGGGQDCPPAAPAPHPRDDSLAKWVEERILPLRQMDPEQQEERVLSWVRPLTRWERLVLFKLLTGELRLGVSQTLVVRALSQASNLPTPTVAARLMGEWTPTESWYAALTTPSVTDDDRSRPYPFYLAVPLDGSARPDNLGDLLLWLIEWKWDGIRAQLVKRGGRIHLWSRGEELITQRFPEVIDAAVSLPEGTVLDGEILAFRDDRPLPFSALQQRIGRQTQIARKARDVPVVFMAYDILEHESCDIRREPLTLRRTRLEKMLASIAGLKSRATESERVEGERVARDFSPATSAISQGTTPLLPFDTEGPGAQRTVLRLSPLVAVSSWETLARLRDESRTHGVEGVMLKRRDSPYGVGRKRGDWWKWKVDPFTIDAVLIYAQPGSGRRASLLTDYTFGVWDKGELVPIAKAYSGLSNEEIAELDRWIRRHTVERFGPVRHVEPTHVFELGFEAIAKSSRHRSGIAVRFPRMLRWRKDKHASEADALDTLKSMVREVR